MLVTLFCSTESVKAAAEAVTMAVGPHGLQGLVNNAGEPIPQTLTGQTPVKPGVHLVCITKHVLALLWPLRSCVLRHKGFTHTSTATTDIQPYTCNPPAFARTRLLFCMQALVWVRPLSAAQVGHSCQGKHGEHLKAHKGCCCTGRIVRTLSEELVWAPCHAHSLFVPLGFRV